ncbi:MAG: TMEM165/GDT1 family protein [Elusimicrobiota bacterium]
MDINTFVTAFTTLFLAEMGDKTQLAAITLTASSRKPLSVFLGALLALGCVTALGVIFGQGALKVIPEVYLKRMAACAFIVIGVWMLVKP